MRFASDEKDGECAHERKNVEYFWTYRTASGSLSQPPRVRPVEDLPMASAGHRSGNSALRPPRPLRTSRRRHRVESPTLHRLIIKLSLPGGSKAFPHLRPALFVPLFELSDTVPAMRFEADAERHQFWEGTRIMDDDCIIEARHAAPPGTCRRDRTWLSIATHAHATHAIDERILVVRALFDYGFRL